MSRIGRKPIVIPAGVEVKVDAAEHAITVKGPKGTLHSKFHPLMTVAVEGNEILVTRPNDEKEARSLHGLTRTLIHNMVVGVTEGFRKDLEIQGVGYRAAKQGSKLTLTLGFSHPVEFEDTDTIKIELKDALHFSITGIDKQEVGQFAAEVRGVRPPEPYKARASAMLASMSSARKAKPARVNNRRGETLWSIRLIRTSLVCAVTAVSAAKSAALLLVLVWMFSALPSTSTLRSSMMSRA